MSLIAARNRIEEMKQLYRRLNHKQKPDGSWDWWLRNEIEEAELEIADCITKMTAGQGDHLEEKLIYQLPPVYTPIPLLATQEAAV